MRTLGLALCLSLVLATGSRGAVAWSGDDARSGEDGFIPAGAVDAAVIGWEPDGENDPTAPYYLFAVFTFGSDDAAAEAWDTWPDQLRDLVADSGLTRAEIDVPGPDADRLEAAVDGIALYALGEETSASAGAGKAASVILLAWQGPALHLWQATPPGEAMPGTDAAAERAPGTPSAASERVVSALTGLAADWFEAGPPAGSVPPVELLPGSDELGPDYREDGRAEGLDEVREALGGGSAATEASPVGGLSSPERAARARRRETAR